MELAKTYFRKYELYDKDNLVFESYSLRKAQKEMQRLNRLNRDYVRMVSTYEYIGLREVETLLRKSSSSLR